MPLLFAVALVIEPPFKLGYEGEQVDIFVARLGYPREVVYAARVGIYAAAVNFFAQNLLQGTAQKFLRVEYLVAATERLYFREHVVQRLYADAHRVGEVNYPRVRANLRDFAGEAFVKRHGAHCAEHAARACGIAYGLIYSVLFGRVHVGAHLFERAGQNGYHHEVGARERAVQIFVYPVFKPGFCGGVGIDMASYRGIALRRGDIYVV